MDRKNTAGHFLAAFNQYLISVIAGVGVFTQLIVPNLCVMVKHMFRR